MSAIGDAFKLLNHEGSERRGIIVIGYEHEPPQIEISRLVSAFELLCRQLLKLPIGERFTTTLKGCVHPVHQRVTVFIHRVHARLAEHVDANAVHNRGPEVAEFLVISQPPSHGDRQNPGGTSSPECVEINGTARYNRIYSQPESEQPAPSEFLVECLQRIADQRERERAEHPDQNHDRVLTALDAGMGDGLNTIPLAQAGYRTVGVDIADVGVNRARKRAAELGLTIDARVGWYTDEYRQPESWDVLAAMYFGFSPYEGEARREQIKNSVKPGGYIIYESAGGVKNDVIQCFLDWDIIVYEKVWDEPHWSAGQPMPGPGVVTKLLARRPMKK